MKTNWEVQYHPWEHAAPVQKKDLWISLLGPLLLVFLVNLAVLRLDHYFSSNKGYLLVVKKWDMLLHRQKPVDWLILGDSSGNQGVIPSILGQRLGGTAINLCTVGDLTAAGDAWMLETYIQKFGPPRGVILVHMYDVWKRDINDELMAKIPLPWGFWERLEPSREFNAQQTARFFLAKYAPLYSQNQSLSELFLSPRTLFQKPLRMDRDGFTIEEDADPVTVEEDTRGRIDSLKKQPFAMSEINQKALIEINRLAEKYDFDVYLVEGPLYRGALGNSEFAAYFKQVQSELLKFTARHPRLHYLSSPAFFFSEEQMQSMSHLIHPAAKTYTEEIASNFLDKSRGLTHHRFTRRRVNWSLNHASFFTA